MAAVSVLAVGSTALSSSDIVVAAATIVCLKNTSPAPVGELAQVIVELKDDAGAYWPVGEITGVGPLSMLLTAAATYRVTRVAANPNGALVKDVAKYTCGVFTG